MFEMLPLSLYGPVSALVWLLAVAARNYPPLDVATGLDSFVERPSVERISDRSEWTDVWNRHRGITPIGNTGALKFPSIDTPPIVNFDNSEVIVLFGGLQPYGGYRLVQSERTSKAIVVRIEPVRLPGDRISNPLFKANPFLFLKFKRSVLPYDIQLPAPAADGTMQWQTVSELAPPSQPATGQVGQGG